MTYTTTAPYHRFIALVFIALLMLPAIAFAQQDDNLFKDVTGVGADLFFQMKPLVYGLASMAILGVGAVTIFGGKFSWGWFIAVVGALAMLFITEPLVEWVTGEDEGALKQMAADFQGKDLFDDVKGKQDALFGDAQALIFAASGMAIIGLGVLSFFGRFNWSWFAAIVGGLFIVNMALLIVEALGGE